MNHFNSRGIMLVVAQALLLGACSSSGDTPQQQAAQAQEKNVPAQVAAPAPAASPDASPGAAGLREFIDPATGQPRQPTAAELKALEVPRQAAAPNGGGTARQDRKETVLPNGMIAVEAGTMSQMKACVQKDGRVVVDHDCKSNAPAAVAKP